MTSWYFLLYLKWQLCWFYLCTIFTVKLQYQLMYICCIMYTSSCIKLMKHIICLNSCAKCLYLCYLFRISEISDLFLREKWRDHIWSYDLFVKTSASEEMSILGMHPGALNWGGGVGLITQGPKQGGGPGKTWNKNFVFILFFFISK